jgi:hypothetical protein
MMWHKGVKRNVLNLIAIPCALLISIKGDSSIKMMVINNNKLFN